MQRAAARRWRLPLAGWRARLFAGYWLRSTCPQSSEGRKTVRGKGPGTASRCYVSTVHVSPLSKSQACGRIAPGRQQGPSALCGGASCGSASGW
jgi:hypothetical protein